MSRSWMPNFALFLISVILLPYLVDVSIYY
jgi:hypothetical protein